VGERPRDHAERRAGHEPTREAAMAAFAKSWRRAVIFTILLVAAVAIFALVLSR
jgi:hypothetical protein